MPVAGAAAPVVGVVMLVVASVVVAALIVYDLKKILLSIAAFPSSTVWVLYENRLHVVFSSMSRI